MSSDLKPGIERLRAEVQKEYDSVRSMVLAPHLIEGSGVASDDKRAIAKELCRRAFEKKLFVSHTGEDAGWCLETLIPVIQKRCGAQSYFFMSLATNASFANMYRVLVEYSFYWAKTVILVLSERSLASDWVRLEVSWAIDQKHPTIVCRLDDTRPDQLHLGLRKERKLALFSAPIRFIDFRQDGGAALCLLDRLLGTKQFARA